jgi:excisionase family DNA binding protein
MNTCRNCDAPASPSVLKRTKGFCQGCELLTSEEAWKLLRVSRRTYYRMVTAGRIHPRQITPGRVLVPRIEIESILSGDNRAICPRPS